MAEQDPGKFGFLDPVTRETTSTHALAEIGFVTFLIVLKLVPAEILRPHPKSFD